MTLSSSLSMPTGARWLVAIALCAVTGVSAAQDAGTRYAKLLADADITARYNTALEAQLQSQQNEMASLQAQIAGMDATAAEIPAMLQKMFEQLDAFVAADVPFLAKERADRVSRLRDLMGQTDKPAGEKFRRLLEAYTIEMEYGRTMEAYHGTLNDGREADFVRARARLVDVPNDGRRRSRLLGSTKESLGHGSRIQAFDRARTPNREADRGARPDHGARAGAAGRQVVMTSIRARRAVIGLAAVLSLSLAGGAFGQGKRSPRPVRRRHPRRPS